MAGAITFNVLLAVVPLLLLVAGIAGFVLTARFGYPTPDVVQVLLSQVPLVEGDVDLPHTVGVALEGLVQERTGFSIVGGLVLLWISTRLVATLRVALRNIFHLEDGDRGLIRGKLFDLQVVLLGGVLILLNVGVTVGLRTLQAFGVEFLGLGGWAEATFQNMVGLLLSFGSAWVLFFLLYWYIPARHIPLRTAAVGATFTAVAYELMKGGFAWYATEVANYSTAYGNLAVVAVLFFWIYYSAAVFILGGHVARAFEKRWEARMGRRNRDGGPPGSAPDEDAPTSTRTSRPRGPDEASVTA
jgi:membrane protein